MQPCIAEQCYHSARRLLAAAAAAPAPADAEQAQLGAAADLLLATCVSCFALSALYGWLLARRIRRDAADGDGAGARGGASRALEEIPVKIVAEEGGVEKARCAVCLAEYAAGEEVRILPACHHGFHRGCVDPWLLTRAPTCPICRAAVIEGPDAKEDCAAGIGVAGARVLPVMWP